MGVHLCHSIIRGMLVQIIVSQSMANNIMNENTEHPNELITKAELARRLKVTPRTITAWTKRLRLPHIKAGYAVRFNWRNVENHLNIHFGKGMDS
jgi:excisionase family DNA binding protein